MVPASNYKTAFGYVHEHVSKRDRPGFHLGILDTLIALDHANEWQQYAQTLLRRFRQALLAPYDSQNVDALQDRRTEKEDQLQHDGQYMELFHCTSSMGRRIEPSRHRGQENIRVHFCIHVHLHFHRFCSVSLKTQLLRARSSDVRENGSTARRSRFPASRHDEAHVECASSSRTASLRANTVTQESTFVGSCDMTGTRQNLVWLWDSGNCAVKQG